jgi:6,7-dimethyl-8-ribityllumazine synthase
MKIIEGTYSGHSFKIAVVLSKFNELIGERLLKGAVECLQTNGIKEENIDIIKVPGAFEIPTAADKIASQKKHDAIICLGAVIRGETPHFDYISAAASNGILKTSLKYGIPVIFGVLTTNTVEQAIERSDSESNSNKGWDAALTAIEMADLMKKI